MVNYLQQVYYSLRNHGKIWASYRYGLMFNVLSMISFKIQDQTLAWGTYTVVLMYQLQVGTRTRERGRQLSLKIAD